MLTLAPYRHKQKFITRVDSYPCAQTTPPNYFWGDYAASSRGAALIRGATRSTGLNEKNLCRHGSQRNAGMLNIRAKMENIPDTYPGEIFCSSILPQIPHRA